MPVSEHQQDMIVRLARQWAAESPHQGVWALRDRLERYGQAQGLPRPSDRAPWSYQIAKAALEELGHA